jgi:hypothetical protein
LKLARYCAFLAGNSETENIQPRRREAFRDTYDTNGGKHRLSTTGCY